MLKRIQPISETIIAKKMSGGYREYRIPAVLCAQNTVFFAYEMRAEQSGDWGDIDVAVLRMETDGSLQEVLKIGQSHLPKDGTMRTYKQSGADPR